MNFKTEESRKKWVKMSFIILLKACANPKNSGEQYLLNRNFFPLTFHSDKFTIENLFRDLSDLLDLNSERLSFEILHDLRDSENIPIASQGKINEIEVIRTEDDRYCFNVSNTITGRKKQFIYTVIIEFIRIKLMDFHLFKKHPNISEHFLFLAGIYFGFGIILTENRSEAGTLRTGFWKKTWRFVSPVLPENIGYSFSLYRKIFPHSDSDWKKNLPVDILKKINSANCLLDKDSQINSIINDAKIIDKNSDSDIEIKIGNNIISEETVKNIIELKEPNDLTATQKNNLGYKKLQEGLLEESEKYFRQAVALRDHFGFANDNLGYVLILQNNLEEGLYFLQQATKSGNNNKGYSFRNLALYHHKTGNLNEAKKYYDLAFSNQDIPIDFLEFHYSELLSDLGNRSREDGN